MNCRASRLHSLAEGSSPGVVEGIFADPPQALIIDAAASGAASAYAIA